MYVELDPILPVLIGLLLLLLGVGMRRVGAKTWVLVVILLVGLGANPDRDRHIDAVHSARAHLRRHASPGDHHPRAGFSSGVHEPLPEYQNFGVASVLTVQGKIFSIGALDRVLVLDPSPPTRCARAGSQH